jgi:hypothetical protein
MQNKIIQSWSELVQNCKGDKVYDVELYTRNDHVSQQYKLSVLVKQPKYDVHYHWNVKCDVKYYGAGHPFEYVFEYVVDNSVGNVVASNEMTKKIFEFLVMPDEKLKHLTGCDTIIQYRSKIIAALMSFKYLP